MFIDKNNNKVLGPYEFDSSSKISFLGSNATVILASKPKFTKGFTLNCGDNAYVYIGKDAYLRGAFSAGENCKLIVGDNLKCSWAVIINAQEKTSISIGDDCLLSNVSIYTSDSHSIFDCETKQRINPASDVKLGDRVWLARNVLVTKGVTVGSDVAVGAGSLVTKDLPSNTVCAGSPAKVIKTNTVWTRERTNSFPRFSKTGIEEEKSFTKINSALQINEIDKSNIPSKIVLSKLYESGCYAEILNRLNSLTNGELNYERQFSKRFELSA